MIVLMHKISFLFCHNSVLQISAKYIAICNLSLENGLSKFKHVSVVPIEHHTVLMPCSVPYHCISKLFICKINKNSDDRGGQIKLASEFECFVMTTVFILVQS